MAKPDLNPSEDEPRGGPRGRRAMTLGNLLVGLGIRGGALALGALTAVVVARVLDPAGVAQALVALSVGTIIGVVAQAGVPAAVAHRIARVRVGSSTFDHLRHDLRGATAYLTAVLVVVALAALPEWPLDTDRLIPGGSLTLLLAAVVIGGGRAVSRILSETNKGFGHVTIAGLGADLIGPTIGLLGIAGIALLTDVELDAVVVAWTLALGWCSAALFSAWWAPARPALRRIVDVPEDRFRDILGVVAVISMLNVGIQQAHVVVAGALLPVAAAGVFATVARLAALTGTPLVLLSAIASPDVGVVLQSEDPHRVRDLEQRLQRVTGLLLLAGLLLAGVFAFAGPTLLSLLFGPPYAVGHVELVILALGPLASLCTGVSGMCLLQAGRRSRVLANTLVGSAAAMVGMVLGAAWAGGTGLAIGYALGQLLINLLLLRSCHQELGLKPFARPLMGLGWFTRFAITRLRVSFR